jgi:hypothetical protein
MKKRTFGVLLAVAMVLVLSLAIVASASATPYLTSVSPASGNNTSFGSYQLKIYGQNLSDFMGDVDVTLQQAGAPYDTIYGEDPYVVSMLGGDYISCYINTYGESAGTYSVEVSGYWLIGQMWANSIYLNNAFSITGTSPVTTPVIASVQPNSKEAGGAAFTMTVYGYNFATGIGMTSTVYWDGTALVTTGGSGSQLSAQVPANLIASAGTASVTVRNTTSGFPPSTVTSNAAPFSVTALTPTLTNVTPTSGYAKYYQPYLLTLTGTNFQSTSQVLVNGLVHAATFIGSTSMSVQLTAADIANPGALNIAVRNGANGQPTNTQTFTMAADTTAPVTTISGADTAWHNTPVTLTVSVTDVGGPGVQNTWYGIGIPPSITLAGGTIIVPAPAGGAGDGAQLVQAYSQDKCGNNEVPPASATVNICTVGPDTDTFAPASVKKGKTCKIQFEADSITPTCTDILKIYKSNGAVAKSFNLGQKASNKQFTKSFTCNLAPGNYKVKLYATDSAGNAQSSMHSDSFQVTK